MAYAVNNDLGGTKQAISTAYKTLVYVVTVTAQLRRLAFHDFWFGADGTPADNAMTYSVDRTTADGTGTGVTAPPLDPADAAFGGTAAVNYTAEPTVTAATSLVPMGGNQRATLRWICQPGSEIVVPATNLAGLVMRAKSPAYTGTVLAGCHFKVQ